MVNANLLVRAINNQALADLKSSDLHVRNTAISYFKNGLFDAYNPCVDLTGPEVLQMLKDTGRF